MFNVNNMNLPHNLISVTRQYNLKMIAKVPMTTTQISFEFFPPQSLEASFRLWDTVRELAPLDPNFVSVTYGAGGTTRELTHEAVKTIHKHYGLDVAAHLTCVDATRAQTLAIADSYAKVGVRDIVALRGDPPKGSGRFQANEDGFGSSVELIEALANSGDFNIRVGAYPDAHPESLDMDQNIAWLKHKVDAGANSAITQFFFEADRFFQFRDKCEKAGIDVPIIPGVLPIENWTAVRKFASQCGTYIPSWLEGAFSKAQRDGREDLLATAICAELCSDLIDEGVQDLHFYTLNKPELTRDVARAIGITPRAKLQNVA